MLKSPGILPFVHMFGHTILYRVTETFDDYSKTLHTRGLLLIDEIDLHLHPLWQKELLDFLQKQLPKLQIVATTHSPITAQQAGVNELFFLQRKGRASVLHQFTGAPKELLLHQIVMWEIFGMKSDQSAEMQKKKSKLVKLKDIGRVNERQSSEKARLEKELPEVPVRLRSNAVPSLGRRRCGSPLASCESVAAHSVWPPSHLNSQSLYIRSFSKLVGV